MSETGLKFAREHDWALKAARMTELYRTVVKKIPEKAVLDAG